MPNAKEIMCPYNPHAISLKVMTSLLTDILGQALRKTTPLSKSSLHVCRFHELLTAKENLTSMDSVVLEG